MSHSKPAVPTTASRPYSKLPRYLHRRGQLFYFKRKIPADLRHVFGDGREQHWKALGTTLLEKARVLLAVEVSEFDFEVAKHRRASAANQAGVRVKSEGAASDDLKDMAARECGAVAEVARVAGGVGSQNARQAEARHGGIQALMSISEIFGQIDRQICMG